MAGKVSTGKTSTDKASRSRCATASADANIALIKYWGKADENLIIPRASSLSLTLDGMATRTSVEFLSEDARAGSEGTPETGVSPDGHVGGGAQRRAADTLSINGAAQTGSALLRVGRFLDIVRSRAGLDAATPARVVSSNTVPYGAGLASSASAFAALAAAASRAAGLDLSGRDLSRLARRGSGSACRSVYGGLVKWNAGSDDETSYAEPVDSSKLDLAIVVVTISDAEKPISSREAMRRTVATSPLYQAWIDSCATDLEDALHAVATGDVERLGEVAEANSMGMHASIMTARPSVMYWLPESVAVLKEVASIRSAGLGAWSTMDAGPNVKVLTDGRDAEAVAEELRGRLPTCRVNVHRPGAGVRFEGRRVEPGACD